MIRTVIREPWLLVLLTVVAVARLTHLMTTDFITDPLRRWVADHAPDSIVYLSTCPWCLSIYISAAAAGAVYAWHPHWWVQVPLLALTASYGTGILEQLIGLTNAAHDAIDRTGPPTGH